MTGSGSCRPDETARKRLSRYQLAAAAVLAAILLLSLGMLVPAPAPASAVPDSAATAAVPVSERFGIASSHLARFEAQTQEAEFQAMKEIKAGWVRCTFAFSDLEWAGRGIWDFELADLTVEKAQQYGVKILGIMCASPPWANGGKEAWYPPTDLDAWRDYVYTVASRYRGRVAAWEIWNEENIQFWQPKPDPVYYVQLLAIASQQIRAADPSAKVVMGGVCGLGADYLEAAFKEGALSYVDAVAYHPYADTIGEEGQPPEAKYWPKEKLCGWILDYVRYLIWQYRQDYVEVWVTEVGWSNSVPEIDYETQAAYDLRTMINYASTNLDRCIIYMLRDEPDWVKDDAGLLTYNFQTKPSYYYFRTFQEVFGEAEADDPAAATFASSAPQTLEAHAFRLPDGCLALAAWKSDNQPDQLTVTVNDPSYRNALSVDLLTGKRTAIAEVQRDASGRMVIPGVAVGKTPVVMVVGKLAIDSIMPAEAAQHTIWLNITVDGAGLQPGATVSLQRGETVIDAYWLYLVSDSRITGWVGLFGAEAGAYDVVVRNPNGEEARLDGGFTVVPACGYGGGASLLLLGAMLGFLSLATMAFRARKRPR